MAKKPAADGKKPATNQKARTKTPTRSAPSLTSDDLETLGKTIAEAIKPEEKPKSTTDVDHISEIIKNARATWFALLGALVFASVTLASVKDVAFFVDSIETKLPLLGISVPIYSFFWAGSLLIAALYIYFHLYLEKLWTALGKADAEVGGKRLAESIHPWLVSDTALRTRDWLRKTRSEDGSPSHKVNRFTNVVVNTLFGWLRVKSPPVEPEKSSSRRSTMSWISNIISISLVWIFGLAVIVYFWWRSMPAHSIGLTGWLAAVLLATIWVFLGSGYSALKSLSGGEYGRQVFLWYLPIAVIVLALTVLRTDYDYLAGDPRIDRDDLSGCTNYQREKKGRRFCPYLLNYATEFLRPARANLAETVFTQKPVGFLGKQFTKQEFRTRWCNEMRPKKCAINPLVDAFEFENERLFSLAWRGRWTDIVKSFQKPDLGKAQLQGANLSGASLEGVHLGGANLEGANLFSANLNLADLHGARLEGAELLFANLAHASLSRVKLTRLRLHGSEISGANFSYAELDRPEFNSSNMEETVFHRSKLNEPNFVRAVLRRADFSYAHLNHAKFVGADLRNANLSNAELKNANLTNARLENAYLNRTSLEGSILTDARFHGTKEKKMQLNYAILNGADFSYSSLRFVDFSTAHLLNIINLASSMGDGGVLLPPKTQRPNNWCTRALDDTQYFGRMRGRMSKIGQHYKLSDAEREKYPAIHPFTPCPGAHHF